MIKTCVTRSRRDVSSLRDDTNAVSDRVVEQFRKSRPELVAINLSADQESRLRDAL
ncbi:MAG: DUF1269 domain-containing protein [Pseudonocardiales bacterium]|nr:DUF1269 domain-containing protein [Pseudonocardiales bacterium]